ncbi:UvrD-like helicase C-terminal domain-containing protein [Flavobacterium succinicans]|uniref:UvrD-like helicase C-terminal domain-containing protein n=3 Tax=Flavobacterium succinicans TaxID=29536 RepID=A0A1I4TMD9_9FLAO|nr:DEAD/DEAH box helicase [Flavobacterium succinicans]SFM77791.1 UvrD-like helicase C-terminal domain-containing protein [Flavobacterium succinicans]
MNDIPENFDIDNREFKFAEQLILFSNRSIYLTGKAGTGKSTFLRYIAQNTTKNYIIVAPTGIAAINAGGTTINSFFQLPFTPFVWEKFNDTQKQSFYNFSREKQDIIAKAELIIIDEISMVRADTIDAIDFRLRNFGGKRNLPFGGKQILFVGDTFQLEPIAKYDEWNILREHYNSKYFFAAKTFQEVDFLNIELKKVYRQTDEKFISLLNKVRTKSAQLEDIQELNKSYSPNFIPNQNEDYITLATKRDIVDATNLTKINTLKGDKILFEGLINGVFGRENSNNEDLLPTNKILELKIDAQVMFVKNDRDRRWVNGTIGRIQSLEDDKIFVTINNKEISDTYQIEKVTWENIKYEINPENGKIIDKVIGTFTQFPVKLAWAITIHKSQGLTFDNVIIDMGDGAFSAGHTYVALSRCKTFEGIKLKTLIKPSDIIVREEVINLSQNSNNEQIITDELTNSQANYYYKECIIDFNNSNYGNSYDNLNKALQFRNDTLKPVFKRLLTFKLNNIKNKSEKVQNLEKQVNSLTNNIFDLKNKIKSFENSITNLTEKNENLIDENELNKNTINSNTTLISKLKNENRKLKSENMSILEKHNLEIKHYLENKIRLETSIEYIFKLESKAKQDKKEISNWKKISLITVFVIFITLFILVIKF